MFEQYLPLLGISLFVFIGVFWRGWLQYRRHGVSGIVLFQATDWRKRLRDFLFVTLFLALFAQSIVFAAAPDLLSSLAIAPLSAWAIGLGSALLFAGLALTVAAQLGMGASWRIGIDYEASPGLVTGGLYQFCRNPIYLGLMLSLVGLAILLPTWPSWLLTAGCFWCIRNQTIEEEAYLARTYGDGFRRYAARIGRFLPGLGKL